MGDAEIVFHILGAIHFFAGYQRFVQLFAVPRADGFDFIVGHDTALSVP